MLRLAAAVSHLALSSVPAAVVSLGRWVVGRKNYYGRFLSSLPRFYHLSLWIVSVWAFLPLSFIEGRDVLRPLFSFIEIWIPCSADLYWETRAQLRGRNRSYRSGKAVLC